MSTRRLNGRAVICLVLAAISVGVVLTAGNWPLKTALFPIATAIVIFVLSIIGFILVLSGKDTDDGTARDFSLTELEGRSTTKPTLVAFGWIAGFFLLVIAVGFEIAVPLFVFLSCYYQGKEKLWVSGAMAGFSLAFFWFLFIWLLATPMNQGLVEHMLGI